MKSGEVVTTSKLTEKDLDAIEARIRKVRDEDNSNWILILNFIKLHTTHLPQSFQSSLLNLIQNMNKSAQA